MTGLWPALRPQVEIDPSIGDLEGLWDRFEVFEALHHSQRICNPMDEREFAELVALLDPAGRERWLDIACGSGELLIRAVEQGANGAVGLDLSPWMLNSAATEAERRLDRAQWPRWVLTEAAAWPVGPTSDCVTCLGADWIWHGMRGTIANLAARVASGGVVAYGGPRLNFGADPDHVSRAFGQLETVADVETELAANGLRVTARIDPGEAGWLSYLERGRRDAEAWARRYPGARAERWLGEHQDWVDHFERDREVVGWSVWVAESTIA